MVTWYLGSSVSRLQLTWAVDKCNQVKYFAITLLWGSVGVVSTAQRVRYRRLTDREHHPLTLHYQINWSTHANPTIQLNTPPNQKNTSQESPNPQSPKNKSWPRPNQSKINPISSPPAHSYSVQYSSTQFIYRLAGYPREGSLYANPFCGAAA